jgi:peptidoglycan/xylan/chitin deacetylase (PgdA/CDA1 family)
MFYYVKTPAWIKKLYKDGLWHIPGNPKVLYLSFDDGPTPGITSFVLGELGKYDAKATFFCIGKNVEQHPAIYQSILEEGHAVGNHTYDHLNGWKTKNETYFENILKAKKNIDSRLFRPPYGRIKRGQLKTLSGPVYGFQTVMWDILSGDFDGRITPEKCSNNVIRNATGGSIIVFHDSAKAYPKMQYALPKVLQHFTERGYKFERITVEQNKNAF